MYTPQVTLASGACRSYSPNRVIPVLGDDSTSSDIECSQPPAGGQSNRSPGLLVASSTSSIMFNNKASTERKSVANSPVRLHTPLRTNSPIIDRHSSPFSSSHKNSSAPPLLSGSVSKIVKNLSGVNSRTSSPRSSNRQKECQEHACAVTPLTHPPNGRQQQTALSHNRSESRSGGMGPIRIPPPGSGITNRTPTGVERRRCGGSPRIIGTPPRTSSTARRSRSPGSMANNSRESPRRQSLLATAIIPLSRDQSSNSLRNPHNSEANGGNAHPAAMGQHHGKSINIGHKTLQSEDSYNERKSNAGELVAESQSVMSIPPQSVRVKKVSPSASTKTPASREPKRMQSIDSSCASDCLASTTCPSEVDSSSPIKRGGDGYVTVSSTAGGVVVQKIRTMRKDARSSSTNGGNSRNTVRERFVTTTETTTMPHPSPKPATSELLRRGSKPRLSTTPNTRKTGVNAAPQRTSTPIKAASGPTVTYPSPTLSARRPATNGRAPTTPSPMRRLPTPTPQANRLQSPFLNRSGNRTNSTSASICNPNTDLNGSATPANSSGVQYSKMLPPRVVPTDKSRSPRPGSMGSNGVNVKGRQGSTPTQRSMVKTQLYRSSCNPDDEELHRLENSLDAAENGEHRGTWMKRLVDQEGGIKRSPRNNDEKKPETLNPRGVSPSRAQRWFAEFMIKLREENLSYETWKSLPKQKKETLFLRWRLTEAQRVVILSAV